MIRRGTKMMCIATEDQITERARVAGLRYKGVYTVAQSGVDPIKPACDDCGERVVAWGRFMEIKPPPEQPEGVLCLCMFRRVCDPPEELAEDQIDPIEPNRFERVRHFPLYPLKAELDEDAEHRAANRQGRDDR